MPLDPDTIFEISMMASFGPQLILTGLAWFVGIGWLIFSADCIGILICEVSICVCIGKVWFGFCTSGWVDSCGNGRFIRCCVFVLALLCELWSNKLKVYC